MNAVPLFSIISSNGTNHFLSFLLPSEWFTKQSVSLLQIPGPIWHRSQSICLEAKSLVRGDAAVYWALVPSRHRRPGVYLIGLKEEGNQGHRATENSSAEPAHTPPKQGSFRPKL